MPIELYRNSQLYDRISEDEISDLLSHFSSNYIIDIIHHNIENRFAYNPMISHPNIISSIESNFKDLIDRYPSDFDNIIQVRQETYQTIIDYICSVFNLEYIGDEQDLFILAYNLYGFLISEYSHNITNFFSEYIWVNRTALYTNMQLDQYKKDKNISANYIKKIYNDSELAIIISHIKEVIYYISGFDIDMYTFLSYNYNKELVDYLWSNVQPMGNIFKDEFCKAVNDPTMLTDIRLALQSLLLQSQSESSKDDTVPTVEDNSGEEDYTTSENNFVNDISNATSEEDEVF